MTLEQALQKNTFLEHKRKVLNQTIANLRSGFSVKNSDMDIEQLIDHSSTLVEGIEHELKSIKTAIQKATAGIEITY